MKQSPSDPGVAPDSFDPALLSPIMLQAVFDLARLDVSRLAHETKLTTGHVAKERSQTRLQAARREKKALELDLLRQAAALAESDPDQFLN